MGLSYISGSFQRDNSSFDEDPHRNTSIITGKDFLSHLILKGILTQDFGSGFFHKSVSPIPLNTL
jgi:hypothetical protein